MFLLLGTEGAEGTQGARARPAAVATNTPDPQAQTLLLALFNRHRHNEPNSTRLSLLSQLTKDGGAIQHA